MLPVSGTSLCFVGRGVPPDCGCVWVGAWGWGIHEEVEGWGVFSSGLGGQSPTAHQCRFTSAASCFQAQPGLRGPHGYITPSAPSGQPCVKDRQAPSKCHAGRPWAALPPRLGPGNGHARPKPGGLWHLVWPTARERGGVSGTQERPRGPQPGQGRGHLVDDAEGYHHERRVQIHLHQQRVHLLLHLRCRTIRGNTGRGNLWERALQAPSRPQPSNEPSPSAQPARTKTV